MKSAFELAMERMGGDITVYTEEQKARLAEIDQKYDAKTAQARFSAAARLQKAEGSSEQEEQVRDDLATELASLAERRQRDKAADRVADWLDAHVEGFGQGA